MGADEVGTKPDSGPVTLSFSSSVDLTIGINDEEEVKSFANCFAVIHFTPFWSAVMNVNKHYVQ